MKKNKNNAEETLVQPPVENIEEQSNDDNMSLLNDEIAELKDKYLRLVAEYDNFRKRTAKEKMELLISGTTSVLEGFLPVIDDLERAVAALQNAKDMDAVVEGINLIYQKLLDYIKGKGVVEIEAINQPFNTDLHDAVTKFPVTEDDKKGIVIDVVQKGYTLNDKVIRYAKVVVGE